MLTQQSAALPDGKAAGILLHVTSLPSLQMGDMGPEARSFVDWLQRAGQKYWQILPLVPTDDGGSPYNGLSAFAGNPLLISLEDLAAEGLLDTADIARSPRMTGPTHFTEVRLWKTEVLHRAFRRFQEAPSSLRAEFEAFRQRNAAWLPDYALFRALRDIYQNEAWTGWIDELRRRDVAALDVARRELGIDIRQHEFHQFLFDRQWSRLRSYANGRGIQIIGDLPIFVAHDSADVWANQHLFQLDDRGMPEVVAGVPPDYFSETGQRWGNPLYRWDDMARNGYAWWIQRLRRTLEMVDLIRIDHFRGFESFWEIPAEEETAIHGRWVQGPGAAFFRSVEEQLGGLPLIAEDLGIITREVEELRDSLELPGMRVVQFAFDGDPSNPHLPANATRRSVAYTGTHDNDTVLGWWRTLDGNQRRQIAEQVGIGSPTPWSFIELVYRSPSALAIVPVQDVLALGSEARLNTPGVPTGNWSWRLSRLPSDSAAQELADLARRTGRG